VIDEVVSHTRVAQRRDPMAAIAKGRNECKLLPIGVSEAISCCEPHFDNSGRGNGYRKGKAFRQGDTQVSHLKRVDPANSRVVFQYSQVAARQPCQTFNGLVEKGIVIDVIGAVSFVLEKANGVDCRIKSAEPVVESVSIVGQVMSPSRANGPSEAT
jgi:hypothetical protein